MASLKKGSRGTQKFNIIGATTAEELKHVQSQPKALATAPDQQRE